MAKISAGGATEVARTVYVEGSPQFLLRSDRVILVKWLRGDGWSRYAKLKTDGSFTNFARLRGLNLA